MGDAGKTFFQEAALLSPLLPWLLAPSFSGKPLDCTTVLSQHFSLQGWSCRVCGIPVHTRVSTCWPLGREGGDCRLGRQMAVTLCTLAPGVCTLPAPHLPSPATLDNELFLLENVQYCTLETNFQKPGH